MSEPTPQNPSAADKKPKNSIFGTIKRNAPGLTRVFLGSTAALFVGATFTDTTQANKIKFVVTAPEGVTPAQSDSGHYIFSGDGYTAYGLISNRLSTELEAKLGPEGEGYGGYLGTGGSYLNLQEVAQDGNELSLGIVQSDVLEQQMQADVTLKNKIRPLITTNIIETVLMPSTRAEFKTLQDLAKASDDAAQGKRPKIKIATSSAYTSGSYYSATIIAKALNPKGIEILDCATAENAINTAKSGAADTALVVEYPGKIKKQVHSAIAQIEETGMHLIQADATSYASSFSKNYSLVKVLIPGQADFQSLLATPVAIVGRNPASVENGGSRNLTAYFQQKLQLEIKAQDICFEQQLPGLAIIAQPAGSAIDAHATCVAEPSQISKITAQLHNLKWPGSPSKAQAASLQMH